MSEFNSNLLDSWLKTDLDLHSVQQIGKSIHLQPPRLVLLSHWYMMEPGEVV